MVKPSCGGQSSTSSPNSENNIVSDTTTSSSSGTSSKYKGVRKRKWGKWVSEIRLPNSRERIWLGSYDSAEKAARAFDAALYCLRGRDAKFNFPQNPPPEIVGGRSLNPQEIQTVAARFANEVGVQVEADDYKITHNIDSNIVNNLEQQYTSSSSVSDWGVAAAAAAAATQVADSHDQTTMDWSFLSMLDHTNNQSMQGMSDYDFFNYPPPPPLPTDDDDQSGGDVFSQSSFLWNF